MKDDEGMLDQVNRAMFKVGVSVLIWIMAILWVLVLLAPRDAEASETWLTSTVHSYHHNRNKEHEEANWGVGVEHHFTQDWGASGGMYRNSYGDRSFYAGGNWYPLHYGYLHFGISVGIVNGYDKSPFSGYFIPGVAIQNKDWGVNIGVVPSLSEAYTVIGLQLKVRIR